jgi:hypothetical protein
MADRFNRLMVRTLRALRHLRRSSVLQVNVIPGDQVNIAQQQVNAATALDRAVELLYTGARTAEHSSDYRVQLSSPSGSGCNTRN